MSGVHVNSPVLPAAAVPGRKGIVAIIDDVAKRRGISADLIRSKRRLMEIVVARRVAVVTCITVGHKVADIADAIGWTRDSVRRVALQYRRRASKTPDRGAPGSAAAERRMKLQANQVLAEVADAFGMQPQSLLIKDRSRGRAWPRMVAMAALRDRRFSYHRIGQIFGLDHTTIIHGARVGRKLLLDFPERLRPYLRDPSFPLPHVRSTP